MTAQTRSMLSVVVLTVATLVGCLRGGGASMNASVAAATLAHDCGGGAGAPALRESGDCAEGTDCGCQQSNMQLVLDNEAGGPSAARVEVVTVRLLDADTGAVVDTLAAREPQVWRDPSGYESWDQQVAPGATLRVSYKLSAPDWGRIGGGNAWSTHSRRFRLQVVLRVDGAERTLHSAEINREPEVVT